MSDFLKKMPSFVLRALSLGCLLILLAVPAPAPAQTSKDQGAKEQATPPKEAPKPRALRTMSPRPVPKEYKPEEEGSRKMQEETLEHKKVTGTAGGQEIRAKPGQEDK